MASNEVQHEFAWKLLPWFVNGTLNADEAVPVERHLANCVPRESYDLVSGSSFAAAHVSGVVALLLEQHPESVPRPTRWSCSRLRPAR